MGASRDWRCGNVIVAVIGRPLGGRVHEHAHISVCSAPLTSKQRLIHTRLHTFGPCSLQRELEGGQGCDRQGSEEEAQARWAGWEDVCLLWECLHCCLSLLVGPCQQKCFCFGHPHTCLEVGSLVNALMRTTQVMQCKAARA
jgi:hypothetical protein